MRRPDPRQLIGLGAIVLVALAPLALPAKAFTIAVIMIKTTGAMSLNTLIGYAGQMSLGQGAFVGVGAFCAANIASRGLPLPIALVAGAAGGGAVAAVTGLPSLRIKGLQVAVTTLAFGVAAEKFLFGQEWFSGGTAGLTVDRPAPFESDRAVYYLALLVLGFAFWIDRRVRGTKAGRAFAVVRDSEERAGSFGVDAGPSKLLAYTVSGAVAGLAGAVFPYVIGGATPSSFSIFLSLNLVAIVIVGGVGSRVGVLASSFLLLAVPELLPKTLGGLNLDPGRRAPLVAAWLLVVVIVALPDGLGGLLRRLGDRLFGPARPSARPSDGVAADAASLRSVPRALSLRVPTPALLVARDVSVRFGGVQALDKISLEVRRGEVVGLIGANGAGKTTFFNVVGGFVNASGSVRLNGRELLSAGAPERPSSGLARTWQQMGLLRDETLRTNMLLAQHWIASYAAGPGIVGLGGTGRTERELGRRAAAALEIFGLRDATDVRVGDLPYGLARRAEIAACVASGPDLLMLDEASAGLTPGEAHELGERFRMLRAELGLTLVIIEHHVPLIANVSDYVYCLESGKQIAEGFPSDVTRDPKVIVSFLGRSAPKRRASK